MNDVTYSFPDSSDHYKSKNVRNPHPGVSGVAHRRPERKVLVSEHDYYKFYLQHPIGLYYANHEELPLRVVTSM